MTSGMSLTRLSGRKRAKSFHAGPSGGAQSSDRITGTRPLRIVSNRRIVAVPWLCGQRRRCYDKMFCVRRLGIVRRPRSLRTAAR